MARLLYLNLDMFDQDGHRLVWRPTFLRCLESAMREVLKPGHPPGCLHRVAQALLAMEDPAGRAREYAEQAFPRESEEVIIVLAYTILRYGQMERPNWAEAANASDA